MSGGRDIHCCEKAGEGEEKSTLRVSPPRLCLTKLQMETPDKKEIELIVIKSCITRRDRLSWLPPASNFLLLGLSKIVVETLQHSRFLFFPYFSYFSRENAPLKDIFMEVLCTNIHLVGSQPAYVLSKLC